MRSLVTAPSKAERSAGEVVSGSNALTSLLAFMRRHFASAVIMIFVGNIAWAAHAVLATPTFVATAKVLVDPRVAARLAQQASYSPLNAAASSPSAENVLFDKAELQTRVELLKSDNIAERVIHDLNLTEDAELSRPGLLSRVAASITALLQRDPQSSNI
jgi:uncharacterized protein involved in exopolysaccharide biosynthesis